MIGQNNFVPPEIPLVYAPEVLEEMEESQKEEERRGITRKGIIYAGGFVAAALVLRKEARGLSIASTLLAVGTLVKTFYEVGEV